MSEPGLKRNTMCIKDCPITSSEKCKELLNKYRDERKKSLKAMSSKKSYEERYEVILNDCYNRLALCDYGAKFSAMPSASLNNILALSINSTTKTPQSPIKFRLYLSGEGTAATAVKKVSLTNTITLSGSGLPVRLRNV